MSALDECKAAILFTARAGEGVEAIVKQMADRFPGVLTEEQVRNGAGFACAHYERQQEKRWTRKLSESEWVARELGDVPYDRPARWAEVPVESLGRDA